MEQPIARWFASKWEMGKHPQQFFVIVREIIIKKIFMCLSVRYMLHMQTLVAI